MARVQVGDVSSPEALRTTLSPGLQMEQQRMDTGAGTQAAQLAQALGVGAKLMGDKAQADATAEARKVLNSMTVDELGKKLKSGELAPNQSPLFMATLNSMYGENLRSKLERDTLEKMETGELTFQTPEELDKYITEARGSYLEGVDPYAQKGFDGKYNQMRQGLMDAQGKITASATVERMSSEATQFMLGSVADFRKENPNATPAEIAASLMTLDANVRAMAPLPPKVQKGVLKNVYNELASQGEYEVLKEALAVKQPSGQTGATLVGMDTARQLLSIAENTMDKRARIQLDTDVEQFYLQAMDGELDRKGLDALKKDREKYFTTERYASIIRMNDVAIDQRRRSIADFEKQRQEAQVDYFAQSAAQDAIRAAQRGLPVLLNNEKVTAGSKTVDLQKVREELVNQTLTQRLSAGEVNIGQATAELAILDQDFKPWKSSLSQTASAIDSFKFTRGEQGGQMPEQIKQGIELYRQIRAQSPTYADRIAGGNKDLFESIDFGISQFGLTPEAAAQAAATLKQYDQLDPLTRKERDAVAGQVRSEVLQPNWFMDFFTDGAKYSPALSARINKLVDFSVQGLGASAEDTMENLKTMLGANTIKVGSYAYLNTDMPQFSGVNPYTGTAINPAMRPQYLERMHNALQTAVKQTLASDEDIDPDRMEMRKVGNNLQVFYRGFPATRPDGRPLVYPISLLEKDILKREADDAAEAGRNIRPVSERVRQSANTQPMVAP